MKEVVLMNNASVPAKYELLAQGHRVHSFKEGSRQEGKAKPFAPAAARTNGPKVKQLQNGCENEDGVLEKMTLGHLNEDEQKDVNARDDEQRGGDDEGESRTATVHSLVDSTILYKTTQPNDIIALQSMCRVALTCLS